MTGLNSVKVVTSETYTQSCLGLSEACNICKEKWPKVSGKERIK